MEKEISFLDKKNNEWRLYLKKNEKYPSRYTLQFSLNGKDFTLQHFPSFRDASSFWDMILLLVHKGGEDAKNSN